MKRINRISATKQIPPPSIIITLIVLILAPAFAQGQSYFDFGSDAQTLRADCPVVVFKHDGSDYYVTIDAAGPVFDEDLEYSRQLCEENFGTQQINQNMGLFHVRRYGNIPSPPMGDVTAFHSDVLGCGRYSIKFEDANNNELTVSLDLTDVNWATGPDNSFRNILFEEDISNTRVKVYISLDSKTSTQLVDCGYYTGGSIIRYWELVRNHGGTWSQYARDRGYFSIDPAYVGPDPNGVSNTDEIPYGDHGNDTLDVDVYIKEDIAIPDGKSLVVTTDPDVINSPVVEETQFLFHEQTGLTIEDGGTFVSTNSSTSGVVDYYCYTSTDKGAWRGIVAEPGSTIEMGVSTVTDAEVGITLDNPADADLLVCGIADARDIGLWIKNCYTAGPVINTCSITRTGDYSGNFRTRNVLIESCEAAPTFSGTGISKAIKNDDGQYHYGGHGVEITGSEEVLFDGCTISQNDSCGFFIHNTVGPYILDTRVDANGRNLSGQGGQVGAGIYVHGGYHWTTLRESRVYSNSYGLYLFGSDDYSARIRGWYHADQSIDPNTPADVDLITIRRGLNCIYENTYNVWSAQNGRCDLGSEYIDGSGVYVTLGGFNGVFDPVSTQGRLDYYSYGGFREVWWNNDPDIPHYNGSVFDNADELLADSVGCSELGKRGSDDAVEYVRRLIAQYRMREPNASQQSSPTSERVSETPAAGNCMIEAVYPNPFNPRATISIVLHEPQAIRLVVTDMLGREVAVLADGFHEAGSHRFTFDGSALASGTYIAVLRGASVSSMPLLLAK